MERVRGSKVGKREREGEWYGMMVREMSLRSEGRQER